MSLDNKTPGNSELEFAIKAQDLDLVKSLIDKGVDVNYNNYPVSLAMELNLVEIFKCLAENGADIHFDGESCLRGASALGFYELTEFILSKNPDINATTGREAPAVSVASEKGRLEIVELLIAHGADLHASDDYAIRSASSLNHVEIIKLLIDNGANIHARDECALRWSITGGSNSAVQILLDNGANPFLVPRSMAEPGIEYAAQAYKKGSHIPVDKMLSIGILNEADKAMLSLRCGFEYTEPVGQLSHER